MIDRDDLRGVGPLVDRPGLARPHARFPFSLPAAGVPTDAYACSTLGPVVAPNGGRTVIFTDWLRGRAVRPNFSLALRRQPASDALHEGFERRPVIGLLHVWEHGAINDQEVGQATQGVGYVVTS